MNTKQLLDRMQRIQGFKGVYPCDHLPLHVKGTAGFIINTDPCYLDGTHWVAVYIKNGKGEYFDSYGRKPQREIEEFLKRTCPLGYTRLKKQLQSILSTVCGNYCLVYLAMKLKGYSTNDFLGMFSNNQFTNDFLVKLIT